MASRSRNACLDAMQQHRNTRLQTSSNPTSPQSFDHDDAIKRSPETPGAEIARSFSYEAYRVLSRQEIQYLSEFFCSPRSTSTQSQETLQQAIDQQLSDFYIAEMRESSEDITRFARPSGPANAEIGLILHQQTRDSEDIVLHQGPSPGPLPTWDSANPSIDVLSQKGFQSCFTFSFDWHWRAEESRHGRGSCSTKSWKPSVKAMHDAMSTSLLELLRLRLLLVCGACAKKNYCDHWEASRQSRGPAYFQTLLIPLQPGQKLEVRLEFTKAVLERITAFVVHPSSVFLSNQADSTTIPGTLEAASNLFLWLLGREYDPSSISASFNSKQYRLPCAAPFATMRRYIAEERTTGRILQENEYNNAFLDWARRTLRGEYPMVLQRGSSIASACGAEMDKRALHAREANYELRTKEVVDAPTFRDHHSQKNRQLNHQRYGNKIRAIWHGQAVKIQENGTVRIFVSASGKALQFRAPNSVAKQFLSLGVLPVLHFSPDKVRLVNGESVIYRKKIASFYQDAKGRQRQDSAEWKAQIDKELLNLA